MIRVDYLQAFLKAYASLIDCKLNHFYDSARMHYIEAIKALESAYTSGQISWNTYKGYFSSVSDSYSDCELMDSDDEPNGVEYHYGMTLL